MLTPFQQDLARTISRLPEAEGFALAGGAALIIHGIIDRRTRDLDWFTTRADPVQGLAAAVERRLAEKGVATQRLRSHEGFVRLQASDASDVCEIDVAFDARIREPQHTDIAPTLALEELAADKTLAMLTRMEARDYLDVAALEERFGWQRLLQLAAEKDTGFAEQMGWPQLLEPETEGGHRQHVQVLLDALRHFYRIDRANFDVSKDDYERVRAQIATWCDDLTPNLDADRDIGLGL